MHLTSEISLGNIAIVVTLIGIAIRFGAKLGSIETTLKTHAETLTMHSSRLDAHETRFMRFVEDLQRMIGRVESMAERRAHPRD